MLDSRFAKDARSFSGEELERLCVRNLLGAKQERFFFKDLDGRFLIVSEGWLAAEGHGLSPESVIGKTDFDIFSRPHAIAALEDEQRIIRTGEPMVAKIERETFDDRADEWVSTTKLPLRDEGGRIIGTFGVARDVTLQMHDPVTGLANRVALMDRLTQALVDLERRPGRLALLFLDIDGFKRVNDTFGHTVGDRVLLEIGRRLTRVSRRFDTVARYGGDEFVILCTSLRDSDDLRLIARRVTEAVGAPIADGDRRLTVTGSLGAIDSSDPTADPEELLEMTDAAMYGAKRTGPGNFHISSGTHSAPSPATRRV